jgi:hypothetical protein
MTETCMFYFVGDTVKILVGEYSGQTGIVTRVGGEKDSVDFGTRDSLFIRFESDNSPRPKNLWYSKNSVVLIKSVKRGAWMKEKNGGPAFPNEQSLAYHKRCECGKSITFDDVRHPGMTLRDWFAGNAMNALIRDPESNRGDTCANISKASYMLADAMISERNKENI